MNDILPARLDVALQFAGAGFPVVPMHGVRRTLAGGGGLVCTCSGGGGEVCQRDNPGRHPISGAWRQQATTDPDTLRRLAKAFPTANWAAALGPAAGLVSIEVDGANNGAASMAALEMERKAWPLTVTSRFGRRTAYFFRLRPLEKVADADDLGPGIRVRFDSPALLPGSVTLIDGAPVHHLWERSPDDFPFAHLPPAWCELSHDGQPNARLFARPA